jgi:hypothetical protein
MGAYLREWRQDGAATEQEWRDARGGVPAHSESGRPASYLSTLTLTLTLALALALALALTLAQALSLTRRPATYLLGEHSAAALLDANTALCLAPTLERAGPNATVWLTLSPTPTPTPTPTLTLPRNPSPSPDADPDPNPNPNPNPNQVWHDFGSPPEGCTLLGFASVAAGELRLGGAEGAGAALLRTLTLPLIRTLTLALALALALALIIILTLT